MRNTLLIKTRAYLMVYVLLITLIISLIASFFLFRIYQFNQINLKSRTHSKLSRNNNNLFSIVLNKHFEDEEDLIALNQISFEENIQSEVNIENWGVFKRIKVSSKSKLDSICEIALIGMNDYPYKKACLYLSDNNLPLNISGNTLLKGDVYIPKSGIRRALINGQLYKRDQNVYGRIFHSQNTLPPLDTFQLDYYLNYDFRDDFEEIEMQDSINHSFYKQSKVINCNSLYSLSDKTIRGNVILYSFDTLRIQNSSTIEDAIVVAPFVFLEENTSFSGQIITNSGIYISRNCELNFPSTLILRRGTNSKAQIFIGTGVDFNGTIVANQFDYKSSATILKGEENSILKGFVYSKGMTDIQSEVHGTLMAQNLQYKMKDNLYRGYLVNVSLDALRMEEYYSIPEIFNYTAKRNIVKWMY